MILSCRASELQVTMQDQAAGYESKVSLMKKDEYTFNNISPCVQIAGRDQEILYLQQEIVNIKRQYEEIYGTKLEDLAEVKVYSGLIVPELQRMRQ